MLANGRAGGVDVRRGTWHQAGFGPTAFVVHVTSCVSRVTPHRPPSLGGKPRRIVSTPWASL